MTTITSKLQSHLTREAAQCFFMCVALVLALGASNAFATSSASGMADALCTIPMAVVNTSIGRGIATLGIIILGIMATLGRITWTQAVVVGVGISVIFGAAALAAMISMGQGDECTT
jgi:type IV secretory pathway VirB2 component (pilin)